MPADDRLRRYNQHLKAIAEDLDIPPSTYQKAVENYEAVGNWLNGGDYEGALDGVSISPQGSFEYGTVIKPLKSSKKAGYDIDLVCEVSSPKDDTTPLHIKGAVGDRLKESKIYRPILDDEGNRCWTLEYAKTNGMDFHLDVLPSVPEDPVIIAQLKGLTDHPDLVDTAIAITNKEGEGVYTWDTSNPRGYSQWFKIANAAAFHSIAQQARLGLFEGNRDLYTSVDQVPDQLIRTPLQQTIQLMKRHRDIHFSGHEHEDFKPISMIITTLAAHLYDNEQDVFSALSNITEKLKCYSDLMEEHALVDGSGLIQRNADGTWYIGNPVNSGENFADRWHEDKGVRAEAFFEWASWAYTDLIEISNVRDLDVIMDSVQGHFEELDAHDNDNLSTKASVAAPAIIRPHIEIEEPSKPWCSTKNMLPMSKPKPYSQK